MGPEDYWAGHGIFWMFKFRCHMMAPCERWGEKWLCVQQEKERRKEKKNHKQISFVSVGLYIISLGKRSARGSGETPRANFLKRSGETLSSETSVVIIKAPQQRRTPAVPHRGPMQRDETDSPRHSRIRWPLQKKSGVEIFIRLPIFEFFVF